MADEEDEGVGDGQVEVDDGQPEEVEESGGGGKKKLLLIIVLPLLLAIGAAAGAYFTGLADPLLEMIGAGPSADGGGDGEPSDPSQPAVFYSMEPFTVDLMQTGRKKSFLKLKVSLELAGEKDRALIEQNLPRLVDVFQVFLRELRVDDLEGAAGMYRVREELLRRANNEVQPAKVRNVLFEEMVVQ